MPLVGSWLAYGLVGLIWAFVSYFLYLVIFGLKEKHETIERIAAVLLGVLFLSFAIWMTALLLFGVVLVPFNIYRSGIE